MEGEEDLWTIEYCCASDPDDETMEWWDLCYNGESLMSVDSETLAQQLLVLLNRVGFRPFEDWE